MYRTTLLVGSCLLVALALLSVAPSTMAQSTETAAAPPAIPTTVAQSDEPPRGFFQTVLGSGWVFWTGLVMMLILLGLSVSAGYLVFDHLMTIRKDRLIPTGLEQQVHQLLAADRIAEAVEACRGRPSFLSFVLLNGIAELEAGRSAVEKAMEDATAEQAARLFRKIEYLSVIGNIAPMIGLLGTVTGMIFAFQKVASTQGAAGAAQLAEGIYQALITTVGGLIVAIPSLGAFAIFRNRVDQLVAEAAFRAQHAIAPLKRRRVQKRAVPPPPPVEGVR